MFGFRILVCLVFSLSVAGCGSFRPGFQTPSVTVSSFKTVPSSGIVPAFEIGLRVTNPNPQALKLDGIAYTISLEGTNLVNGVTNELPTIPAYGQGDVSLSASADLLAGARVVGELLRSGKRDVDYAFEARLDLAGLLPAVRVRDAGQISLQPGRQ
jgi:LEA14-like dessication related protein